MSLANAPNVLKALRRKNPFYKSNSHDTVDVPTVRIYRSSQPTWRAICVLKHVGRRRASLLTAIKLIFEIPRQISPSSLWSSYGLCMAVTVDLTPRPPVTTSVTCRMHKIRASERESGLQTHRLAELSCTMSSRESVRTTATSSKRSEVFVILCPSGVAVGLPNCSLLTLLLGLHRNSRLKSTRS